MVGTEEKSKLCTNELLSNVVVNRIDYLENITDLDLSNRNLASFSDDLHLPKKVVNLNLARNKLTAVPARVLNLHNLKTLDVSFNLIVFFDDPPNFCHTIEYLNMSNNRLEGPPFWVWSEKPKQLVELNLSNNKSICHSFTNGYVEELLNYTTPVQKIDLHNCKLTKHVNLMASFCHAKVISLGSKDYDICSVNHLNHVPCAGLDECCDIERLNLSNTQIYHISSNIDIYKNLIEIDLAQNYINCLPNEFCNLANLQTCILSFNKLLYLPDTVCQLTKLERLHLDNNELCMLPEALLAISSLKTLDLYNNNLCECIERIDSLEEIDFSQNYFEEPNDGEYLAKKEKLRKIHFDRDNGKKREAVRDESDYSDDEFSSVDDGLHELTEDRSAHLTEPPASRASTPEDWDSDEYWIPQYYKPAPPPSSSWLYFVKKKMEEGNFCPMDAHAVSIAEKVKYEKMCNPQTDLESDGQFDDYSDDDS